MQKIIDTLTLFTSMSTLLCCALPALFVTIGAGATLASITTNIPGLIWVSQHKDIIFIFAGFMLSLSAFLRWHNHHAPCPIDSQQALACRQLRHMGNIIFWISTIIFVTGLFFAYIAPTIF